MIDNDIQDNKPVVLETKFANGASAKTIEEGVRACLTGAEKTLHQWNEDSEDLIVEKRGMRFCKDDRSGQLALDVSNRHRRRVLLPTRHARVQVSQMLNSRALSAKALNLSLDNADADAFLCRTMALSDGSHSLRAFLPSSFSTGMDNLPLCAALKTVLDEGFITMNSVSGLQCRLDSHGVMLVDVRFDKKELKEIKQLEESQEEYTTGLRLCASEIGHDEYIAVEIILTRLVCLNGWTADRDRSILISYIKTDALGESKVQKGLNELIRRTFDNGVKGIGTVRGDFEGRVKKLLDDATEDPIEGEFDDSDVRAALDFIIKRAGLNTNGVTVENVSRAYYEEKKRDKDMTPAWLLVNAFTRYATHHLMMNNMHLGRKVQRAVYERLLNHRCISWKDIAGEVRERRRILRGVRI